MNQTLTFITLPVVVFDTNGKPKTTNIDFEADYFKGKFIRDWRSRSNPEDEATQCVVAAGMRLKKHADLGADDEGYSIIQLSRKDLKKKLCDLGIAKLLA